MNKQLTRKQFQTLVYSRARTLLVGNHKKEYSKLYAEYTKHTTPVIAASKARTELCNKYRIEYRRLISELRNSLTREVRNQ